MSARPEGSPVWADAMYPDLEAAKAFYAELFGWSYDPGSEQFGNYTQAKTADGKHVAALVPQMPGTEGVPPSWNLYLAAPDVTASAAKARSAGGTLMTEPMQVGDFGTMVTVQDPAGVMFSLWQPASHEGFEKVNEPGAFCWAEVNTRDAAKTDAFFTSVFPYEVKTIPDENMDFDVWQLDGAPSLGRMQMTDDFPAHVPSYVNVYFVVEDCDAAVATVQRLGGKVYFGPMDSPFGRCASIADPQGCAFSIIDVSNAKGEMPELA
ncbi:VOC family protein [Streptomyces sp. SID8379]|uniref:VOC family protein n=1 Tax=unclassified Streptomyces TaxID=2593676 RepID=UPI000475583C|nr:MULTISPECIES: VOC family protein [unclassified Streptomyces]MYW64387.1 VOC family protein [Streptomyces sp. SID8379]